MTPNERTRLDRLVTEVWAVALEGRRDYDLVRQRGAMPLRVLAVVKAGAYGGDPAKVDWSACRATEPWGDHDGLDVGCRCSAAVAIDAQYLYVRLTDPAGTDPTEPERWLDDFEIFVGPTGSCPFSQVALFHDGTLSPIRYEMVGGKRVGKPSTPAKHVSRVHQDGTWEVLVACRWRRSGSRRGHSPYQLHAREFEARQRHVEPTYTPSFPSGFDNAGVCPSSGRSGVALQRAAGQRSGGQRRQGVADGGQPGLERELDR